MDCPPSQAPSRRSFIASVSATAAAALLPMPRDTAAQARISEFTIRAAPARARLVPKPHGLTDVWAYNGTIPGPEIRVKQGHRIRVNVHNDLNEASTVHWHGMRVPNAMDGVPHLTQLPIEGGGQFIYEFDAIDAGTFWYHPHQRSYEQVGRGLYGPLIVEEAEPIRVDRELTWVLDDWRLTESGAIDESFGNLHDMSHNGRVGNTVTINGQILETVTVRSGERIRLRLINAANARIFGLHFSQLEPIVIALDGQPVSPHVPTDSIVVIGPAMRVDLILDMSHRPEARLSISDKFYQGLEYRLVDLIYADTPLRNRAPQWPMALPPNPLAEPDLGAAEHHRIEFEGGMMGTKMGMMHSGKVWFINGVAAQGHVMEPMLTLRGSRTYVIAMTNSTAWHHPIHLHGHSFRVLSRNNRPTKHREWQDTVLMAPREHVEIALVADNPGDWMFHCHILEHQASGMMGVIRVDGDGAQA